MLVELEDTATAARLAVGTNALEHAEAVVEGEERGCWPGRRDQFAVHPDEFGLDAHGGLAGARLASPPRRGRKLLDVGVDAHDGQTGLFSERKATVAASPTITKIIFEGSIRALKAAFAASSVTVS